MQARRPREGERAASGIPEAPSVGGIVSVLTGRWWAVLLRGILGVVVGLMALAWPGITLVALVLLIGAYAFADGILGLVAAFSRARPGTRRWPLVLEAVLGIGVGLVTAFYPGITVIALLALIAAWSVVGGIVEIVEAVRLRKQIEGEWLLALAGALSVAFGVLVVLFPAAGALSIVWLFGVYAIAFGVVLIALALRLRRVGRLVHERQASPA
jgi:uncharacterized membrane protein HdeD (DUF308 family)